MTSISFQILRHCETGCNNEAALKIQNDALHYFSLFPPKVVIREKHNDKLPRTVIRTQSACFYILQNKGNARLLGEGNFSKVVKVLAVRRTGLVEIVSGKIVKKDWDKEFKSNELLKSFSSCFLLPPAEVVFEYFRENNRRLILIGERFFCDAESQKIVELRPGYRLSLAADFAAGLALLHAKNKTHNDIKLPNLFIRYFPKKSGYSRCEGVVADLGLFTEAGATVEKPLGSPYFWAPETIKGPWAASSPKDIWAFGIALYQLLHRTLKEPPFLETLAFSCDYNEEEWIIILSKLTQPVRKDLFFEGWTDHKDPAVIEALILQCFSITPSERPSAEDLLKTLRAEALKLQF